MSRFKNFINRWQEKHKLSYTNEDTFFEKWSVNVSFFNMLTIVLLYTIILGVTLYILILFTPLKKVIFDDVSVYELSEKYDVNSKRLKILEKEILAKDHYINDIQNILNGGTFVDTSYKALDSLEGINSVEFNTSIEDSIFRIQVEENANKNAQKNKHFADVGFFMSPVEGNITKTLDLDDNHFGVDIATKKDEPIKAALEGLVIFSEWTSRQGHVIIIQHSGNLISAYKHCSVLLKSTGDQVDIGDPIAIVGNTGLLTDGPHLHFEIWQNGVALNPQEFINF